MRLCRKSSPSWLSRWICPRGDFSPMPLHGHGEPARDASVCLQAYSQGPQGSLSRLRVKSYLTAPPPPAGGAATTHHNSAPSAEDGTTKPARGSIPRGPPTTSATSVGMVVVTPHTPVIMPVIQEVEADRHQPTTWQPCQQHSLSLRLQAPSDQGPQTIILEDGAQHIITGWLHHAIITISY
eukprot:scaffold293151_cov27-Prasinocladus_malaysianus.AAC.3